MKKQIAPHEKIGELLASISKPVRVQILLAIGTGEACVCHLESLLGLRQAYISQNLMTLRKTNIISSRREGKYIYYRLVKPEILDLIMTAGESMGFSKEALFIRDHTDCECPKCASEGHSFAGELPVNGRA